MPREIGRDPNCLHCAINALADRWIEKGRVSPTEAVLRIAVVLGSYIGLFAAADRQQAIAQLRIRICAIDRVIGLIAQPQTPRISRRRPLE
jgi:hypothetical protein